VDDFTVADIPWGISVQPDPDAPLPLPAVKWLDVEGQLAAMAEEDAEAATGRRIYLALPAVDEQIGGIRRGEVCGLMARPGIGKTVVLCHVAQAVTEHQWHAFFSLEMPAAQIVARLQQRLYRLGRHQREDLARAGVLDLAEYRRAYQSLLLVDTPGLAIWQMGQVLDQMLQSGPLKGQTLGLVTIDHLGLVGGDRKLSTYDRVSVQAREIKELAKRFQCAVLLAIQVNRDSGGDGSRELSLGSARDSGVVEEAMDYLIGMRRLDRSTTLSPAERDRYRDVLWTKVIKNRHGDAYGRETAYRLSPIGLQLTEDRALTMDDDQVAKIAAQRSGNYR
jgi:replicative DNA helicase